MDPGHEEQRCGWQSVQESVGVGRSTHPFVFLPAEMRLKEMVSMGVGNKPFLDIQPSDAAISDRAVHYMMKSRGAAQTLLSLEFTNQLVSY